MKCARARSRRDKPEIRTLFENLDLSLTDEQFDVCFKELDREQTGEINFYEFAWWWFLTKYGRPRISSGAPARHTAAGVCTTIIL